MPRQEKRRYEELGDRLHSGSELKHLLIEGVAARMGVELDEEGFGFKDFRDPKIKVATGIVEEVLQEQSS